MMVKDMQPYNIVNDEGFREFVYALDPRYQLPSRSTLIRNLEEQYDTTKTSLKKKMEVCIVHLFAVIDSLSEVLDFSLFFYIS